MNRTSDRDRIIEQLLKQSAETRIHADSALPGPSSTSSACIDADVLSAYIDGGLTDSEKSVAERHVARCVRCQSVLASIVHSAPVEVQSATRSFWRLSWLVPASAAVVAVAIWIALPPGAPLDTVQMQQKAPAAPVSIPPAARPSEGAASASARADDSRGRMLDQLRAKEDQQRRAAQSPPPPAGMVAALEKDALGSEPARKESGAVGARRDIASAAPAKAAAEPVAPPPSPAPQAFASSVPPAPSSIPAPQPAASRDAALAVRTEAKAFQRPYVVVECADGPARLRFVSITPVRNVDRSSDAGATWLSQPIGLEVSLTAGACPSRDVAWAVGARGVVLVSKDGKAWQRAAFPLLIDLMAITAEDAMTAQVTASDGRRFETRDGGATWTLRQ